MKSKFLRMVSVVMLSAFLAVTAVVSPAAAAGDADKEECQHPLLAYAGKERFYPIATESTHKPADKYIYRCTDCQAEVIVKIDYFPDEAHIFDSNNRCIICRYYRH